MQHWINFTNLNSMSGSCNCQAIPVTTLYILPPRGFKNPTSELFSGEAVLLTLVFPFCFLTTALADITVTLLQFPLNLAMTIHHVARDRMAHALVAFDDAT